MAKKRPLTIVDNGFLITETEDSPKHIAGLQTYQKPKRAAKSFVKNLMNSWAKVDTIYAPYNLILNAKNPLSPYWEECPDFKVEEHLFYLELQHGTQDELNTLVSELHEARLDQSKPLWRCFLIDGVEDNQFAIYFSFHHSVLDGISAGKTVGFVDGKKHAGFK